MCTNEFIGLFVKDMAPQVITNVWIAVNKLLIGRISTVRLLINTRVTSHVAEVATVYMTIPKTRKRM